MKPQNFLFLLFLFITPTIFAQSDSLLIFTYPGQALFSNNSYSDKNEIQLTEVNDIPDSVLKKKNLKRITFMECPGVDMPSLVRKLQKFPNLISLGFIECEFGRFPVELCELTNLHSLTIVYDHISEIPESISKLSNLEFLDLGDPLYGGNSLQTLPASMSKLSKLRVLHLFGNQFSELPECCTQLSLTLLNLSQNSIHDFIPFTKIHSLEDLSLYSNPLQRLPQLENLHSLKFLDITSCDLQNESPAFDLLLKLEELRIGQNPNFNAEEIFQRLAKLQYLKKLNLFQAGLKTLPISISNFPALETLELDGCDQMDFNQAFSMLYKITTLRTLSLRQCWIKNLPDNIILLQQVRSIDLYFNKLETLGPLCEMTKLEKLYLVSNPLPGYETCLSHLSNLKELYLPSEFSKEDRQKVKKLFPDAHIEFY